MYPAAIITALADEVAVGSGSAEFSVLKMIVATMYMYVANVASWICQGIIDTVFTANGSVFTVSAGHKLYTGEPVQLTAGTSLPTGLSTATTYYAIVLTPTTFALATTRANALAGTAIATHYILNLALHTTHINTVLEAVSTTVAPSLIINGGAALEAGTISEVGTVTTVTLKTATSTVTDFEALMATSTLWTVLTPGTGANTFVTANDAITSTPGTDAGVGTLTAKTVATAGAGSAYVPANTPVFLNGSNGTQLSQIEDSTGGKASLYPVQL